MGDSNRAREILKALMACTLTCTLVGCGATTANGTDAQKGSSEATTQDAKATTLAGWQQSSESLASLTDFVKASVDEDSASYIPPEDRIAVFDMDGTLMGERFPTNVLNWLSIERGLGFGGYEAPADLSEHASNVRGKLERGDALDDSDYPRLLAVFDGLTVDEFKDVVRTFKDEDVWGFEGMTYGEALFEPMVSVVEYLHDNGYAIYIDSGTWRDATRVMCEGTLERWIPQDHVIGSDPIVTASGQGDESCQYHTMGVDEQLVFGDAYLTENFNTNKAIAIEREIGKHPVLAFGNSRGDLSMANYALSNPSYAGQAYMVVCDDTERDYGDAEQAQGFAALCEQAGYHTISMRDDWATVYGEDVRKVESRAAGTEVADAA